jgi:pSer/pThr/pTyr-binding forkhead associated (FHA) protein
MRFILTIDGNSFSLPVGETLLGRGLSCTIRFNDATVSRKHVRIVVDARQAMVEDLGSRNTTFVNSHPLVGARPLKNEDEIRIGRRFVKLHVVDDERGEEDEITQTEWGKKGETLEPAPAAPSPQSQSKTDLLPLPEFLQKPSPQKGLGLLPMAEAVVAATGGARPITRSGYPVVTDVQIPVITQRSCPQCRGWVAFEASLCTHCGAQIPLGRAVAITQKININEFRRRLSPRYPVDIPVIYVSETLTFDGAARDLSLGGIFLASDLLDPIGTRCTVTLLPDGSRPIAFEGRVCHVTTSAEGEGGHPPGLGIQFSRFSADALQWLTTYLQHLPVPKPA